MRGTLAKRWGNLDCGECSPSARLRRGCSKAPADLRAKAAAANGWRPITSGPSACPTLAVEADPDTLRLLDQHTALVQWGSWPHSPQDHGAQAARWSQAMRTIRAAHAAADAELRGG